MITLEQAIMARDVETAMKLIEAGDIELTASTRIGVSTLMLALYYELPEMAVAIRRLLPEISFFEAAAMGEMDAVKAVIDRESGMVNAFAPDGFTVLGLAIFFRQPKVAAYLIRAGADVNLPTANARKVAPIHAACARQDLTTLQLLLANGANPDAAQDGGFTPLRQAIKAGNQEMEAMLRASGAELV